MEIHKVFKSGGMLEMRPLKFVPVPADEMAELKPGSYHLMIIGLKRVPKIGENVKLFLNFNRAGKPVVIAKMREGEVRPMDIKRKA